MQSAVRNGKIEFLRFYFCIAVLLFHINKYIWDDISINAPFHLTLVPHGAMGVEFFFMVSGFLMARSAYRNISRPVEDLGRETGTFLWKKLRSILPFHVIAFAMSAMSFLFLAGYGLKKALIYLFNSIPAFFLLQMFGFQSNNPNHLEWYISAMLIAMVILYPIVRRHYTAFVYFIAPLLALGILGYFSYTSGFVTDVKAWMGIAMKGMFRAVADLSLGVISFELVQRLTPASPTPAQRAFATAAEVVLLAALTIFFLFTFQAKYEMYALFAIFLLITLAFSGVARGSEWFNNKFCLFLGRLTLPIYLSQVAAINLTLKLQGDASTVWKTVFCVLLTGVLSVFLLFVGEALSKRMFSPKAA